MGHPVKGKSLHRVQVWFLHRMQGRKRSPPMSPWQGGCPEIIPKLRALPWWSSAQLEWLPKLQVRDPTSRKALVSAESKDSANPTQLVHRHTHRNTERSRKASLMSSRSSCSYVVKVSSSRTARRAGL